MAIEFRCTSCEKLLRTPDESAGKNAKCPQCGAIVPVPGGGLPSGGATPASWPSGGFSDASNTSGSNSPFATDAASRTFPSLADKDNPYASPGTISHDFAAFDEQEPATDLRHCKLDFETVFRATWKVFAANIGPCVLVGLVAFGVYIGLQIFAQIGTMATQASGEMVLFVAFQIVSNVFVFLMETWVNICMLKFALKLSKTGSATVGDMFAIGHCFWRATLATVLVGLIMFGVLLLFGGPYALFLFVGIGADNLDDNLALILVTGIPLFLLLVIVIQWVYLRFFLYLSLIIDRRVGIIESLQLSQRYMHGNKLVTFLVMLVVSVLGGLFSCITCYIGLIFFLPYIAVFSSVVYLLATGQRIAETPKTR